MTRREDAVAPSDRAAWEAARRRLEDVAAGRAPLEPLVIRFASAGATPWEELRWPLGRPRPPDSSEHELVVTYEATRAALVGVNSEAFFGVQRLLQATLVERDGLAQ